MLAEKEKIVDQMSKDSRSLHVNLETIQNKIQETGNIVHLKKKLQEEKGTNSALKEEIAALKLAFLNKDLNPKSIDMTASIEEITGTTTSFYVFAKTGKRFYLGQVQQQLDYSAHLDFSILEAVGAAGDTPDVAESNTDNLNILHQRLAREAHINGKLRNEVVDGNKKLEVCLAKLDENEMKLRQVEELLENEKRNSEAVQIEDATLLEQLRIRLEGALETQRDLEKVI